MTHLTENTQDGYRRKPFLVAWDFQGVLNTFGTDVEAVLVAVRDRGGEQIIVSQSEQPYLEEFVTSREIGQYFTNIYGQHQHHGRNLHHKTAALLGHQRDAGPFAFCLMIGDSLSDMTAAREAGCVSCLYDPHGHVDAPPDTDYVIRQLGEVLDLLPLQV